MIENYSVIIEELYFNFFDSLTVMKSQPNEIYVYLIATCNYQINIQRISERADNGGHSVSKEKIISRYQKSIDNAFKVISYTKRYYVIDNSQYNLPTLVTEIEMGKKYNFTHPTYQPQWTNRFLTIK